MNQPELLTLKKRTLDLKEYRFRSPQEEDIQFLITQSTIVVDNESGLPRIAYLVLEEDCTELVSMLHTIDYVSKPSERTSGLLSQSRIFGYRPRITIRDDFCTTSALATEHPEAHSLLTSYAKRVADWYSTINPSLYTQHEQTIERVLPQWRLLDTVFTSGIINKNNPLPYHFDAGNFRECWSNMLVFKHRIAGGYLSCPEYGIGFEVCHNSLLMFDGQNILHGVTPIHLLDQEESFRYSIVYYALQQMWNCLPPQQEVERIQELRTKREEDRLQRQKTGEAYDPKKTRKLKERKT